MKVVINGSKRTFDLNCGTGATSTRYESRGGRPTSLKAHNLLKMLSSFICQHDFC